MGIRVVRDNGQPFDFGYAALREIVLKGLAVDRLLDHPVIPWFLNYFWPLWDDQNRALHDMAASTTSRPEIPSVAAQAACLRAAVPVAATSVDPRGHPRIRQQHPRRA